MIIGTGIDITETERIKKAIEKHGFTSRFFTENEEKYFKSKSFSAQTIAAHFAAKEAFSKALGTGIRGFNLKDVEVLHDDLGKPYFKLYENAQKKAEELGIKRIFLTLSHCEKYAVASVTTEGEDIG